MANSFTPAKVGETIILRLAGTGFAFHRFDNMMLAHAVKVSKTGRVQAAVAYKSGKRYARRDVTELYTLPAGVTGDAAHAAFPECMFLPWQEGVALLRQVANAAAA
jgi:hypothetical protein